MNNRKVLVTVCGLHTSAEDGQSDEPIEITYPGTILDRDDMTYVRYEEVYEGTDKTTVNLIKYRPGYMEVSRKGMTRAQMVFDPEKKHETLYDTPMGTIRLGIVTTSLKVETEGGKTLIRADYALEAGDQHVSDCSLQIRIAEIGG